MNIEKQKAIVQLKMKEISLQIQRIKETEQEFLKEFLKHQGKMELLESLEEQEDTNTTSNEDTSQSSN